MHHKAFGRSAICELTALPRSLAGFRGGAPEGRKNREREGRDGGGGMEGKGRDTPILQIAIAACGYNNCM